MTTEC